MSPWEKRSKKRLRSVIELIKNYPLKIFIALWQSVEKRQQGCCNNLHKKMRKNRRFFERDHRRRSGFRSRREFNEYAKCSCAKSAWRSMRSAKKLSVLWDNFFHFLCSFINIFRPRAQEDDATTIIMKGKNFNIFFIIFGRVISRVAVFEFKKFDL